MISKRFAPELAKITSRNLKRRLAILGNGQVFLLAEIKRPLLDGKAEVSGLTLTVANELETLIYYCTPGDKGPRPPWLRRWLERERREKEREHLKIPPEKSENPPKKKE